MPGPKPTPTAILKMRGSWRGKKNKTEPHPETGAPRRPSWLAGDGRRAWEHLTPKLVAMGVLTKVDGNALARYCAMWASWRSLTTFIEQHGTTYTVDQGDVKPYPQVKQSQNLADQLLRLEQQFGLTPSARARMTTEITQEKPDKAAFFHGGK